MPLAFGLWLAGAYVAVSELFTNDALFGKAGLAILLLSAFALYRAQKVAKSAEVWRDAAAAEKASGEAWREELEAQRARADRLERDREDARTVVAEQLLELADLRARTDLQPLQDASERHHAELVQLLSQVVETNNKIVAAVVKSSG